MLYKQFKNIYNTFCIDMFRYLYDNRFYFSMVCHISKVSFNPPLPEEIVQKFGPFPHFILAGYTFESLYIRDDKVTFEAGFGSDDEGNFVEVSIDGIYQIIIGVRVIFSRVDPEVAFQQEEEEEEEEESHQNTHQNTHQNALSLDEQESIQALFSNQDNLKIIQDLKK